MKITKKRINENTITRKGEGFNPYYSFRCQIKANEFSYNFFKEMGQDDVYVMVDNFTLNNRIYEGNAGRGSTKKDFINTVHFYINS